MSATDRTAMTPSPPPRPRAATPVHLVERHRTERIGWIRAAVLGANDGIVSTGSLVVGVAAANADRADILLAGVAGLVAGAFSMAAGEYVSVSSQADIERADLAVERHELSVHPEAEEDELTEVYRSRGLDDALARTVAQKLMAHDALAAHARDELGFSTHTSARPLQAAWASAASFAIGAAVPLAASALAPRLSLTFIVAVVSMSCLAALGAVAARIGGGSAITGAVRVTFWGALAMAATAAVGALFGTSI